MAAVQGHVVALRAALPPPAGVISIILKRGALCYPTAVFPTSQTPAARSFARARSRPQRRESVFGMLRQCST